MVYEKKCCNCSNTITYKYKRGLQKAIANNTMCSSCRTSLANKSLSRNNKGSSNAAWKGLGDVPGKVLSSLRNGAKTRSIPFEVTLQDIYNAYNTQYRCCALSGIPVVFGQDASVDRIDSTEGYFSWNIQIVHKDLNMMKKAMPDSVFIQWCRRVAEHNK